MIIQHNMQAANSNRMLGGIVTSQAKSTEKLSSGFRINRAADDAAGLSISEKMRSQIRGLNQASTNAQDGISLIQTAEGALNEQHAILQRMRELSVQAANGTETDDDRTAVQDEIAQLQEELTRIADTTEFNTMKLLNGNLDGAKAASTTGSVTTGVADAFTATSANLVGGSALGGAPLGVDFKVNNKDTIVIDGASITVDWATALDNVQQKAITDGKNGEDIGTDLAKIMEEKINEAIDKNNEATGTTTAHVKVALDGSNNITITSGSTGASSNIEAIAADKDSLFGKLGLTTTAVTGVTAGTATQGSYTLNEAIAANDEFSVHMGDQTYQLEFTAAFNKGDDIDSVASALQTLLQDQVAQYNTDMGLTGTDDAIVATDVTVCVQQGKLVVEAPEGLAVTFGDEDVAKAMGLNASTVDAKEGAMLLQIGANEGQTMSFNIGDMSAKALGVDGDKVDISTQENAKTAMTTIDAAIKTVSQTRGRMGAIQNRLEHTIANLDTSSENLQTAESRIRDVDMAEEMVEFSKNNILQQAAQSMLAQANQSTQGVLALLR